MRQTFHMLLKAALAGAAVAAPASAAGPRGGLSPVHPVRAFTPPAGPMVLTREVRKTLGDGQSLVSRRRYAVRFAPEETGWRLDARLASTEVDAPVGTPVSLVELERTRRDDERLTLRLDRNGMIVAQPNGQDPAVARQALAATAATLERSSLSPADRAGAAAVAQRLVSQARSQGSTWPTDLFRPAPGTRTHTQALPFGDGSEGMVTVTLAARTTSDRMTWFERRIRTEAAGTNRLSVETWTLAPAE